MLFAGLPGKQKKKGKEVSALSHKLGFHMKEDDADAIFKEREPSFNK
jgi:hypothetical protein